MHCFRDKKRRIRFEDPVTPFKKETGDFIDPDFATEDSIFSYA